MADADKERREDEATRETINLTVAAVERVIPKVLDETLTRMGFDTSDPLANQHDQAWVRANRVRCQKFFEEGFQRFISAAWKAFWIIIILGVVALLGGNLDMLKGLV